MEGKDVLIVDTSGRLHVDVELMDELKRIRGAVKPHAILLVVDAMTGQDAVNVAEQFAEAVDFDGVVMSKLDGDARGGAALSVKAVTGKPIVYASTGEKLDQFEKFHPDRMAQRILGMGDVLSFIEKAEQQVDEDRAAEMEKRLKKGQFTFEDFLEQMKMMRKMGPLSSLLGMIPGMGAQLRGVKIDDRELDRIEAIVLSMTPEERRRPELIKGSRRQRIAEGSGTSVQAVNGLVKQFGQMQKVMKQLGKGRMPDLGALMRQSAASRGATLSRRMSVRLRLTRIGGKKDPVWRLVVADQRSPRDGRVIEIVGHYNAQTEPVDHQGRRGEGPRVAVPRRPADGDGQEDPPHAGHRVLKDLLAELARMLVSEPEAVKVDEFTEDDGTVVLEISVGRGRLRPHHRPRRPDGQRAAHRREGRGDAPAEARARRHRRLAMLRRPGRSPARARRAASTSRPAPTRSCSPRPTPSASPIAAARVIVAQGHRRTPILRLDIAADRTAAEAPARRRAPRRPGAGARRSGRTSTGPRTSWAATVVDGDRELGVVASLLALPSCEALELDTGLLVPMVRDAIRSVDVEARRIDVDGGFLGAA